MRRLWEVVELLPGGHQFRDEATLAGNAESRVASLSDSLAPPLPAVARTLSEDILLEGSTPSAGLHSLGCPALLSSELGAGGGGGLLWAICGSSAAGN